MVELEASFFAFHLRIHQNLRLQTTMTKGGKEESDITWHGTTAGAASDQRSVQICHLGEARGNQLGHGWPDFFLRMFDPS